MTVNGVVWQHMVSKIKQYVIHVCQILQHSGSSLFLRITVKESRATVFVSSVCTSQCYVSHFNEKYVFRQSLDKRTCIKMSFLDPLISADTFLLGILSYKTYHNNKSPTDTPDVNTLLVNEACKKTHMSDTIRVAPQRLD